MTTQTNDQQQPAMTDAQFDAAAYEMNEGIRTFLSYCPDGSERAAIDSALQCVDGRDKLSREDFNRLKGIARRLYGDFKRSNRKK